MAYNPPPGMGAPYPIRSAGMPTGLKVLFGCLAGCAVLLVLLIIGAIFALRGASKTFKQGDQIARQFIGYIQHRQLDLAYAMTSTAWHRSSTRADFNDFASYWLKQQGSIETISQAGWYVSTTDVGTAERLTYNVHGSRRDGQVVLVLVNEGGRLRVQSCHFSPTSPAIGLEKLKSPSPYEGEAGPQGPW
ncbi:MAG TPA: hypothetical protein VFA07_06140 [Chthonomonadaceae bacterium]|nr:hypothetical protein [Chthonomonadaceae bacterium]